MKKTLHRRPRRRVTISEDIVHKFWREYDETDTLERPDKIKAIITNIDETRMIEDKDVRQHCLQTILMGYFDDLMDYMSSKKNE